MSVMFDSVSMATRRLRVRGRNTVNWNCLHCR